MNGKKSLIIIMLLIVFLGVFWAHKMRVQKRGYSDFHCYYTAGKRILSAENIYVIGDKEVAEFRYAPIFALGMSILALMPEAAADTLWFMLNFCLLVISFILMRKMPFTGKLGFKKEFMLYLLAVLGVVRFILNNFDSGQTNILMLSSIIVGLYCILKKREFLGGIVFAFSVMIKYTPLIFIPYFLLRKRIKLALVIIGSVIMYLTLPVLFIGFKANIFYLKNLIPILTNSTILEKGTILDPKNQSLFSLFSRFFTRCIIFFHAPPMPFQSLNLSNTHINLIFVFFAAVIYLMILYVPRKITPDPEANLHNLDYASLLICSALFNLNAWMHNYIFMSFGYFILISYMLKTNFKEKSILIFLILSYILNFITVKLFLGKTLAYKTLFYSPHTISGLIVIFLLLKLKFYKNSREER